MAKLDKEVQDDTEGPSRLLNPVVGKNFKRPRGGISSTTYMPVGSGVQTARPHHKQECELGLVT